MNACITTIECLSTVVLKIDLYPHLADRVCAALLEPLARVPALALDARRARVAVVVEVAAVGALLAARAVVHADLEEGERGVKRCKNVLGNN